MRTWAASAFGKPIRAPACRSGKFSKEDLRERGRTRIDMDLYFLRHGEADWPDWEKSDDERPLTKRGKKEMHEVAAFLKRLKVCPDVIVTSPLPRASQTAGIVAEHLKLKCHKDKLLA